MKDDAARPEVFEGSGNVFADLGLPDAEELLAKAEMVRRISVLIDERGLSQSKAAEILGTSQPVVSELVRGQLRKFSIERLILYLNRLDWSVEIHLKPRDPGEERAHL
ncbi:MAG: XRE family transcriptional regulator, partial [Gemmatimonadetes bacterium]|nr:XRE family transcriptional regulator [Gemmatimonadota bacterium]